MKKRFCLALLLLFSVTPLPARPRYRLDLRKHYGAFLEKRLDACTTCHISKEEYEREPGQDPATFEKKPPHNLFGARLKELGKELSAAGRPSDMFARLRLAAREDSDGDGVLNEIEILSGRAPGRASDKPNAEELAAGTKRELQFELEKSRYAWEPFHPVVRPPLPQPKGAAWARSPIDLFLAVEHEARGLTPRPEASKDVLLRRVFLDLIGLPPAPEELQAFLDDPSPDAYESMVDRLLSSPRYGERWGRHWMDVWRYSDWAGWGNQVRDSQPHVWRWRDWIIESLNEDKGYDRMVMEMLAADEMAPGDRDRLRATGYLVRNFKLLSREAWMQETVDHAAQAFLGITAGCARCHDHMFDPISQKEYYRLRAVFEPYNVRLDRLPGEPDTGKDGLARVFDANLDLKTFLYIRGDDRNPAKDEPLAPGVPEALAGPEFKVEPVSLPLTAYAPGKADYVVQETMAASEGAVREARAGFEKALLRLAKAEKDREGARGAADPPGKAEEEIQAARQEAALAEMGVLAAEAKHAALLATLDVEKLEDSGASEKTSEKASESWKAAATEASKAQRWASLLEARRNQVVCERALERARAVLEAAQKAPSESKDQKKATEAAQKALSEAQSKLAEGEKQLAKAREDALLPPSLDYKKRDIPIYPATSSGRRLALARWIAHRQNPLAARVAANNIWLWHFGQAIVPSANDFGQNGRPPSHPALLDWLSSELMEPALAPAEPWSMKHIHRLIVTSSAYRMASTPDESDLALDPDNRFLWRMPSRRLDAEIVRDSVLWVAGGLDLKAGGPELDQKSALTTFRRSLYYRNAAEKQVEFLQLFDMAGVSECYERKVSVVPQQALAMANSELTLSQSRRLAQVLSATAGSDPAAYVASAFEQVLSRRATPAEAEESMRFLKSQEGLLASCKEKLGVDPALRAREDLVHALMNHNDFVTTR